MRREFASKNTDAETEPKHVAVLAGLMPLAYRPLPTPIANPFLLIELHVACEPELQLIKSRFQLFNRCLRHRENE